MTIDVAGTIAGLDELGVRMDHAVFQIAADSLHSVQAAAMVNAPVGTPGNTTNAPGDLARSIDVQGPSGADGVYKGEVGPTVIYGRQRELGGEIYPVTALALHFWRFGEEVYTHRVFQEGSHYLERAYNQIVPVVVEEIAVNHVADAIIGTQ